MHFGTKSYLKSNRNHTAKHAFNFSHKAFILGENKEEKERCRGAIKIKR
jgi:hypothetical protein